MRGRRETITHAFVGCPRGPAAWPRVTVKGSQPSREIPSRKRGRLTSRGMTSRRCWLGMESSRLVLGLGITI
jgi:hypothetical protein